MLSPPRFAAIDVGSNSVKLRIVARETSGAMVRFRPLLDRVAITGLGRGVSTTGTLDEAACQRTLETLVSFTEMLADYACQDIAVIGTQCLREARNAQDFIASVKRQTKLAIEVISGQDEARLAFIGASTELPGALPNTELITFDIGGGSTELCRGRPGHLLEATSLDIGALHYTEGLLREDPPAAAAVSEAEAEITRQFATFVEMRPAEILVGIGGTPASLGAVEIGKPVADSAAIHGKRLERSEVARQIGLYQRLTVAERRRIPGLHPDRADVILAGAMIVAAIMDRFARSSLVISTNGLRQGLLRDRFRTVEIPD